MLRNSTIQLSPFLALDQSIILPSQRSPRHTLLPKSITAYSVRNRELAEQEHLVGKDQTSSTLTSDISLKLIHILRVEIGSHQFKEVIVASRAADGEFSTHRKYSTATIITTLLQVEVTLLLELRLVLKSAGIRDFHKRVEVTDFKKDRS